MVWPFLRFMSPHLISIADLLCTYGSSTEYLQAKSRDGLYMKKPLAVQI